MKPTSEKIKHKKIFGFDIETFGKENTFLMGSFVSGEEKYIFWNKEEMVDFVFNSHILRGCLVFATNLSFDFLGLFGDYENLKQFDFMIRGTDFISVKYKYHNGAKVTFLDTMNFLKLGVENIGNIIKIHKGIKPDYLGTLPLTEKEKKYLEEYNIQDSFISYSFAEFLQNNFNAIGTNIKYTIASTSKSLFTNKYLNDFILQPNKEMIRKQFKAYYGGRTEAFYRGLLPDFTRIYDINSLYPYVMSKYLFPNPNYIKESKNPTIDLIKKYEGISLCIIKAPKDLDITLLPYRTKDKLIFPLGVFKNWQTHAELRKALELGYQIEPLESVYFEKTFNPFKEFVKDLYSERMKYKKLNNPVEICYKLLLNSLYGKFAQKLETKELYFKDNPKHRIKINEAINENKIRYINGKEPRYKIEGIDEKVIKDFKNMNLKLVDFNLFHVTDLDSEKYPKFINPILSLYITSFARLDLYKWIEKVKNKNGIVYYVDTDSLFTNIELPNSKLLGDLKLEYTSKKGIIIKPKFYYLKTYEKPFDVYKIKGLMGINSYDKFYGILKNKEYKYTKFIKFKESYRRKLKFNEKIDINKTINLEDNKRNWKKEKINIDELEKSEPLIIFG